MPRSIIATNHPAPHYLRVSRVAGLSMLPALRKGDLIMVDSVPFPRAGSIVVANVNNRQILTRLHDDRSCVILTSDCRDHPPIAVTHYSNFLLHGEVIAVVRAL